MLLYSSYKARIKHYNRIFKETIKIYRDAVDFIINVCLKEYDNYKDLVGNNQVMFVEKLIHKTSKNKNPKYNFDKLFYKFPSYLRRSAISEAIGKVSSYKSNYNNWLRESIGNAPSKPIAGFTFPCMYNEVMYKQTNTYSAKIKVYIRNTWDWIDIELRKSDIDYILHHCADRHKCAPVLVKRYNKWYLDFAFKESKSLNKTKILDQVALGVDLGINQDAAVCVMNSNGTIKDRLYLNLSKEKDHLTHLLNRVKKYQQNNNKVPHKLWGRINGINNYIAVQTANFIIDAAIKNNTDVIVLEHLDTTGKKKGSKRQRLHMWKCKYVQNIVKQKAHRAGIRVSTVNTYNTSRLAFDGTGKVKRGSAAGFKSYNLCRFESGKIYNSNLNAAYNISGRYFIREILKSYPVMDELAVHAKVPELAKRSSCTLSTLISLNVEMKDLLQI